MGWLRLVGSIKWQVPFAEYCLFYRALLQKRPIILRSLLTEATTYTCSNVSSLLYVLNLWKWIWCTTFVETDLMYYICGKWFDVLHWCYLIECMRRAEFVESDVWDVTIALIRSGRRSYVAVGCSVLQWVVVCCSVLQCVAVYRSALQCVAVCCSVLQCVAVCWSDQIKCDFWYIE